MVNKSTIILPNLQKKSCFYHPVKDRGPMDMVLKHCLLKKLSTG
ncbi:hypothetical protein DCCM_3990 [Desulfocucumis palustris]|uniref:Uncharacterized protein n=1 Tax=Desulfocucumis palustris TaxID=1898651 RepID=A0A2L2XFD3_9FIRM|nr:hypothetical protein DCCM_3990 [Desulfocucumis palustris]